MMAVLVQFRSLFPPFPLSLFKRIKFRLVFFIFSFLNSFSILFLLQDKKDLIEYHHIEKICMKQNVVARLMLIS